MQEQTTTQESDSRLLFSTYDDGTGVNWSLRVRKGDETKPVVLCQSNRNTGGVTLDVMREFFKDPTTEARLRDLLRRHGLLS